MSESRFLSLLGNARTVGLIAFLLSAPIGILAALAATHDPLASFVDVVAWLAIGVLSQLAMGAALLLGNVWLVTRDLTAAGTRAGVVVVAVLAGATRGVAVAVLPEIWELPTTTSTPVRIVSSAVIFGLWLVILGAALGANDRYRSQLSELVDELATQELQLRLVDAEHSALPSSQANARIVESATPLMTALSDDRVSSDHLGVARLVQDAIEERLRPLSHEFWFDRAPVIETPWTAGDFISSVLRTPIAWRRALPIMTVLLLGNSLVRWGWPTGAYSGLVASALVALIVITCTWLGREHRLPWNLTMYTLLLLVPAPAAWAMIEATTGTQQRASVNFLMALGVPLALMLGAATNVVIRDRRATLRELRERIADRTWDAHLGELHRRRVESDAASVLHNTVQSRLVAASLQLEQAAAQGDQARAEQALTQVREVLDLAASTGTYPPGLPPRERLEELVIAWRGIADVAIDLPDRFTPEPAWRTVVDAVEECVTNAVRHAHATRVSVRFRQTDDAIEVEVDDDGDGNGDGDGPAPSSGVGLGRSWMASVTEGRWNLTTSTTGATVSLRIPT